MTIAIDRRLLIKASMMGLGAMALPGFAALSMAQGFTHGVASGEPSTGSVLLWTRHVSASDTKLRCEVAADEGFTKVVGGGQVVARGEADHTAKLIVTGLNPGCTYYYRFIAPDGSMSPVGRTRTLPDGEVSRFGIGLFSCSNMPYGWFNAYAHAAARDDLDLMLHVGDYFYEYGVGTYPSLKEIVPGREIQPTHEIITLADYRLRYAAYRTDPDLQRLHQRFAMVAQWDDHEFANDSWQGGAENHQPATEGDWAVRKAIAERVYYEWMPVSEKRWSRYQIGNLATIFRPETRITARTKQLELEEALAGRTDLAKALVEFRDGPWSGPDRTLMGAVQEKWLADGLRQSVTGGTRWQVLAQQIVMGNLKFPKQALDWVPANAPDIVKTRVRAGVAAAQAGLPFNFDSWDGYPAARERLLTGALQADSNLIVLSGDSHNAWGNNLVTGGSAAGVEFGGHSVTSPGFETFIPQIAPADVARALRETNPGLAYADTSRRGYVSLELTPDSVTGTWHFSNDIRTRNPGVAASYAMRVRPGVRTLEEIA
jgi:alkaline phosphatase D